MIVETKQKTMRYVNVVEVDQHYGGPEEGGWWYDSWVVQEVHGPMEEEAAWELADELREGKWKATGKSSSTIYAGGDYRVWVTKEPEVDGDNWSRWE